MPQLLLCSLLGLLVLVACGELDPVAAPGKDATGGYLRHPRLVGVYKNVEPEAVRFEAHSPVGEGSQKEVPAGPEASDLYVYYFYDEPSRSYCYLATTSKGAVSIHCFDALRKDSKT